MNWAHVIRKAIDLQLQGVYTMLPGRIESYDPETQLADVKPLLKRAIPGATTTDGETTEAELTEELPVIPNVKVQFPRVCAEIPGVGTLDAHMYFPVKEKTLVMLVFSGMSLDKWSAGQGTNPVDPQDPRHHDLSDAVAIIGMFPDNTPIPDLDDDDIRIVLDHPIGGKTEIGLGGDTGDIWFIPHTTSFVQIGAKEAAEALVLGETLRDKLSALAQSFKDNASSIVQTGVGPGTLSPTVVNALTTFIDAIDEILCAKAKVS